MRRREKEAIRKQVIGFIVRYLAIITAVLLLGFFYKILLPLTIYPVYWLLTISHQASVSGSILSVNEVDIQLVDACIAGSAYLLLIILNLSTRRIKPGKRMALLAIDMTLMLMFNILRIFILIILYLRNFKWFDITHQVFWYVVSVIAVVLIWIYTAKWFRVKGIPFISDLMFIKRILRI